MKGTIKFSPPHPSLFHDLLLTLAKVESQADKAKWVESCLHHYATAYEQNINPHVEPIK